MHHASFATLRRAYLLAAALLPALLLLAAPPASAANLPPITYSGQLIVGTSPVANGHYDLQFGLFTAATGGSQVGSTVTLTSVPVVDGVFYVTLNFGNAIMGQTLFLQTAYRLTGGGSYTTQTPRSPLPESAYADYASLSGNTKALQGHALSSAAPTAGQVLEWTGTLWTPTTFSVPVPLTLSASSSSPILSVSNTGGTGGGISGFSLSSAGISGESISDYGLYGTSQDSYAVYGNSLHASGIYGSGAYLGVSGSGGLTGVSGSSDSGTGVTGTSASGYGGSFTTSSGANGVYGKSDAANGSGVYGAATTGSTEAGVTGAASSSMGGYGVFGTTSSGIGVYGVSISNAAVAGSSQSGYGFYGVSNTNDAGHFYTGGGANGVYGESESTNGNGVEGVASTGASAYGIYGKSASGYAGYFSGKVNVTGDLNVTGTITAGTKDFKIDHPLDPENKYLSHACIESNEMADLYSGNVTLGRDGAAWVQMPDWFGALNRDFRYQLTCIGGFAPVYIAQEIAGNKFQIAGGKSGMKISWQVTGIRQDAYAAAHPLQVEEDKPAAEQGLYLHPKEWNQPEALGIGYARQQAHRAK